jgi:hypothetical protein
MYPVMNNIYIIKVEMKRNCNVELCKGFEFQTLTQPLLHNVSVSSASHWVTDSN